MKLKIIANILLFFAISSVLWVVNTHNAEAIIPTIKGKVVNKVTGAPVPNVWVKLTTSGLPDSNCTELRKPGVRYERADSNGQFNFPPVYYYNPNTDRVNRPIDTNLDGKNDAVMIEDISQPYCEEDGGVRVYTHDFGCLSVPFSLTAVKPYNFDGSFSTVNLVFGNLEQDGTVESNNIVYTPNQTAVTPSPTPRPSVNVTPTPRVTPTPTNSPSPSPAVGCLGNDCTQKRIGELTGVGSGISDKDPLESGKKAWIKIAIKGYQGNSYNITLNEKVTGSNFKINPLIPNTSFYIKKQNSSASVETDITSVLCGSGSCIQNQTETTFIVTLGAVAPQNIINVYFSVTPTAQTTGSKIPVDAVNGDGSQASTVIYSPISGGTAHTVNVNNVSVSIDETRVPFFQAFLGDVFSNANNVINSIKSYLPSGEFFAKQDEPIVISHGGTSFGNGQVSPPTNKKSITFYPEYKDLTNYESISANYKNKWTEIANSNYSTVDTGSSANTSYYFKNGDYIVDETWNNKEINKKITIFVNGDLYITRSFKIKPDGNSSVVFIVKGRLGIDPDIQKIEGIYLIDGVIDTACNKAPGFQSNNSCLPAESTTTLEASGIFYSLSGFNLERNGYPGEKFIFRPDLIFAASSQVGKITYTWKEYVN